MSRLTPEYEIDTIRSVGGTESTPPADTGETLPQNLKLAMDRLRKLRDERDAMPWTSHPQAKARQDFHATRIAPLEKHIAALQNGPPPPPFNQDQATAYRGHRLSQPKIRADRLANLTARVDAGEFDPGSPAFVKPISTSTDPNMLRMLCDPAGALYGLALDARSKLARYAVQFFENYPLAYPEDRTAEIKAALQGVTDPATVRELTAELTLVSSPASRTISQSAKAALANAAQPLQVTVALMKFVALDTLRAYKAEAVEDETKFLAVAGLPHTPGPFGQRFDAAIRMFAECAKTSEGLTPSALCVMHPDQSGLELFGLGL